MNKNYAHVSVTNSKLGSQIPSVNFPAIITCNPDAPCTKGGCYACKGNWLFKSVQDSLKQNLENYLANPQKWFDSVNSQITLYRYFRFFSSGDIPNSRFLQGMCWLARKNPDIKFLCFTKKFKLVNAYLDAGHKIPSNLKIVFSTWNDFIPENPHNLPTTWVYAKDFNNNNIPKEAIPCTGHCPDCLACWSLKHGQSVYFHKH